MDYQKHIDELATELGCVIKQSPELPGMMYVEFGYVEGPTIVTQKDYITCLHELGHFAKGHTQGRPPKENEKFYFENGVLRSEAEAWDWALDHCAEPLDEASRIYIGDACLGSYYRAAIQAKGTPCRLLNGDRHHVEFVYDTPGAYFARVFRRITEGVESCLSCTVSNEGG